MRSLINNNIKNLKLVMKYGGLTPIILILLMALGGIIIPYNTIVLQDLIDSVLDSVNLGFLTRNAIIVIIIFISILIFINVKGLFEKLLQIKIAQKLRNNLLPEIANKTAKLKYENFEDREIRDLISRVGSSPDVAITNIFWKFLFLPSTLITLIGYYLIYLSKSYVFLIAITIISIFAIILRLRISRKEYDFNVSRTLDRRKAGYLSGLITNKDALQENKVFQSSDYLNNKWENIQYGLTRDNMKLNFKLANKNNYILLISFLVTAFAIGFFIYLVDDGVLSYGEFVALSSSIFVLVDLVTWEIPFSLSELNQSSIYWEEYEKFMNLKEDENIGDIEIDDFNNITFDNVYFTYPKTDNEILKGINFTFNKNDTLTIVGENGTGKSTIIKLLLRLYQPTRGRILIDNYNLNDISHKSLVTLFSPVFQDFFCYKLTLKENIAFGNMENINDDDLIKASCEKIAEDITKKHPLGLDVPLGKIYTDGIDLSGGEWQKVALARAIFSDAQVFILDEPTSSLDPKTEFKVYENFNKISKNKTSIFISHRLGIARLTKKILVIHNGQIYEEGSHDELIAKKGKYKKMFLAQSKWYR